jgi:glycosyltransferase involved in cell wall biosynthesis
MAVMFPSYMEGFGLGVLEKLASGIPVIAYDVPGPRDVLTHTMMVPVGDWRLMAERLREVLCGDDESYMERVATARNIAARYAWPLVVDSFLKVNATKLSRALNRNGLSPCVLSH